MKILTLNTHSIIESDYKNKLNQFAEMILKEKPDVFALQEVNQSMDEEEVKSFLGFGYVPCKDILPPVRRDNHALNLDLILRSHGVQYNWTWIPLKIGYGIYEEGLAIFSLTTITDIKHFYISNSQTMENWKTRKILGIQTCGHWFYSVHMGWWDDKEEPFSVHWDRVIDKFKTSESSVSSCAPADTEYHFIMGDFNSPANVRGEGYDYVVNSGWYDTWMLAEQKDSGITVGTVIDGWKDRVEGSDTDAPGMRIEYIWCNQNIPVRYSKVICNGTEYPIVSDHYGVEIEFDVEHLRR